MLAWLKALLWPALRFVFQCIVCGLTRILEAKSAEEAKARLIEEGWRGQPISSAPKGWRCPGCADAGK